MKDPVLALSLLAVGLFIVWILVLFCIKIKNVSLYFWDLAHGNHLDYERSAYSSDPAVLKMLVYLEDCDRPSWERPKTWKSQMADTLNGLCDQYWLEEAEVREEIRRFFVDRRRYQGALIKIFERARRAALDRKSSRQFKLECLRRGLAALSIQNVEWSDHRPGEGYAYKSKLKKLYQAAARAGLDPNSHFTEISSLSSEEPAPYGLYPTLREIFEETLEELEESMVNADATNRSW